MEKIIIQVNRRESPGVIMERFMIELEKIGIGSEIVSLTEDDVKVEFFVEEEEKND